MLPAKCSARCCPPEGGVSCEPASTLFAVLFIGGCCDHAEKLQSSAGRLSQTNLPRPSINLSFGERADISFVHPPFYVVRSIRCFSGPPRCILFTLRIVPRTR